MDSINSNVDKQRKAALQAVNCKESAKKKLEKELKDDKDKSFAEPVIGYLLERCAEDEGLAQDVAQDHKTWKKCIDYIYEQAQKQAVKKQAVVRSDVVYEWAEDYYHKDDKAEEEEKAKKEAEKKEKRKKEERKRARAEKKETGKEKNDKESVPKKKENKPEEQPKPKQAYRDLDGQLDIFSMMEM